MKAVYSKFLNKNKLTLTNYYNFQKRFYEQNFSFSKKNSKVFVDIAIDGNVEGRIVFELFSKHLPRTSHNFISFITGFQLNKGSYLSFKGTKFHKIIPGMLIQGGATSKKNDVSVYGGTFGDENYIYSHDEPGILSMVNDGPNSNGSQFFITTSDCSW
jgi:cyclophilin family peptidyl-prolyl cis-trans isomerase